VEFKPEGSPAVQYRFELYTKSIDVNLQSLSFYSNPLVSNSSDAAWTYDARTLDDYSKFGRPVNLKSLPYREVFYAIRTKWTLEPLLFTSGLGLLALIQPAANTTSVQVRLNGGVVETEYLSSFKTFRPLVGENSLEVQLIPEEPEYNKTLRVSMRLLDPDTNLTALSLPSALSLTPSFASSHSVYRAVIPVTLTSLDLQAVAAQPNATMSLMSGYSVDVVNDNSELVCTIEIPQAEVAGIKLQLRVTAESSNVFRDVWLYLERQDICGNGRRWSTEEACDDGNAYAQDGCDSCLVEPNWTCQGGSVNLPDQCSKNSEPTANPSQPTQPPQTPPPSPSSSTTTTPTSPSYPPEPDAQTEASPPAQTVPQQRCGDGEVSQGEECDDGNTVSDDGCSSFCRNESNGLVCGDGLRVPQVTAAYYEECDDGNNLGEDGCSPQCLVEAGWICTNSSLIDLPPATRHPDVCMSLPPQSLDPSGEYSSDDEAGWFPWLGLVSFSVVVAMSIATAVGQLYKERHKVKVALNNPMLYVVDLVSLLQVLSFASLQFDPSEPEYEVLASLRWSRLEVPGLPRRILRETAQLPLLLLAASISSAVAVCAQQRWPRLKLALEFLLFRSFVYIFFGLWAGVLGSLLCEVPSGVESLEGVYAACVLGAALGAVLILGLHRVFCSTCWVQSYLGVLYEGVKGNSAVVEPVIQGTARRLSRLFVHLPPAKLRRHFSSYEEPEEQFDRSFVVNKKEVPPFLSTPLDHKYSEVSAPQVSQFVVEDKPAVPSLSRFWVYHLVRLLSNCCLVVGAVEGSGLEVLAPTVCGVVVVWCLLVFSPLSQYNYSLCQCLTRLWTGLTFLLVSVRSLIPSNILVYLLTASVIALLMTFVLSFTAEQLSLYRAPSAVAPSEKPEVLSVTATNLA
jgi:cysteine-rich repeat protein